jgi:hypothetical protein
MNTVLYTDVQFASLSGKFLFPIRAESHVLEDQFVAPVSVGGLASFLGRCAQVPVRWGRAGAWFIRPGRVLVSPPASIARCA